MASTTPLTPAVDDDRPRSIPTTSSGSCTTSTRTSARPTTSRTRIPTSSRNFRLPSTPRPRSTTSTRSTPRSRARFDTVDSPEPDPRARRIRLLPRHDPHSRRIRARLQEQVVDRGGGSDHPEGGGERRAGDHRRTLRRLGLVAGRQQAALRLRTVQPAKAQVPDRVRGRARARQSRRPRRIQVRTAGCRQRWNGHAVRG